MSNSRYHGVPRIDADLSHSSTQSATHVDPSIDPAIEDRASEGDRLWFAARPGRRYRLRRRLPGEGGGAFPELREVLVYQVRPGFRFRHPVGSSGGRRPRDCDTELARLAEFITAGEPAIIEPDGRVVSPTEMGADQHDA